MIQFLLLAILIYNLVVERPTVPFVSEVEHLDVFSTVHVQIRIEHLVIGNTMAYYLYREKIRMVLSKARDGCYLARGS